VGKNSSRVIACGISQAAAVDLLGSDGAGAQFEWIKIQNHAAVGGSLAIRAFISVLRLQSIEKRAAPAH
jgi:hypothetical protein